MTQMVAKYQRYCSIGLACWLAAGWAGRVLAVEYDPSQAKLEVTRLTDKLYKLQCISGTYVNTLASVGKDGILLVDTGYPQTAALVTQELGNLGDGNLRIVVNSHEHNDHVAGNGQLAETALVVAHERVRKAYGGEYFALEMVERPGIPNIVFEDALSLFFNGEQVRINHYPGGHTLGDVVVHFTDSEVAFVGDMVFAGCFPSADVPRGGDLNLCLANVQKLIDDYPDGTRYVSGHGPDYTKDDLKRYLDVGVKTRELIDGELEEGRSIEDIAAAGLLRDWVEWGEGVVSNEEWIACVHQQYLKDRGRSKASVCQPLTAALVEDGIDAAIRLYDRLRKERGSEFDFSESELNTFGYRLLARDMVAEAIEIFALNVQAYPRSGNVYDSLAEAYMAAGDDERAVEFYVKSLELDPGNGNARGMLERLGYEGTR